MSMDDWILNPNPESKKYTGPITSKFIGWVSRLNAKYSSVGNPPIYDNEKFPWVKEVEKEWKTIRKELDTVMVRREELPEFDEIINEVAAIKEDKPWKTFLFAGYGLVSDENCKRCPDTTRILKKIPGMKTSFFSILSPNLHIPAHHGPYNGVLRYHLGLIVPEPKEKCRIRVHDEIRNWDEGESLIFDDTYNHEVWNDTPGYRVILFVDFVRPMKFPFDLLNKSMIFAASFSSTIKKARDSQKKWEEKFYKT